MYSTENNISTPQNVAFVAKQILSQYTRRLITFSPYRLAAGKDEESLLISTIDGRGIILVQRGEQIESNLKSGDYVWFDNKLSELKKLRQGEQLKEPKNMKLSLSKASENQPKINSSAKNRGDREASSQPAHSYQPTYSQKLVRRKAMVEDL